MVYRIADHARSLPRPAKRVIAILMDVALCLIAVAIAYWLRLGELIYPRGLQWLSYIAAPLIAVPLFAVFGQYRAIFRYVGWMTLMGVVRACVIYALAYAAIFTFIGIPGVPRTVGFIQPIVLLLAASGWRATVRYWLGGGYHPRIMLTERRRAIIFGAGAAGRQLEAALAKSHEMEVVAFVDDDAFIQGAFLNGIKIHPAADLAKLVADLGATDFLLAIPSATRRRRAQIIEMLSGVPVMIRTIPGVIDIAQGRVKINELRELEIDELLGRDSVSPNELLLSKKIAERVVLVTGAGGSIGSELCRQILRHRPAKLILVEGSEFNLYSIHKELETVLSAGGGGDTEVVPILGSVLNAQRMDYVVARWRPNIIYHAAAYKHVPLVEHNPSEGLLNNAFGTLTMADAAERHQVQDFVLVSTDKAVRPTNVMGATKRLAEQILQAKAALKSPTCFSMVRFGNVLGSSGSVVPLFRQQIRTGGPVTITHAEMTRYFMTIPEASQLVIQAAAMASGGEVFVLDMGEPVKILDLARRMIELSGLTVRSDLHPEGDIEIEVVGMRPGEKLYEELLIGNDPQHTSHRLIMKAHEDFIPWRLLAKLLDEVHEAAIADDEERIRALLKRLVPEFRSDEQGADRDERGCVVKQAV